MMDFQKARKTLRLLKKVLSFQGVWELPDLNLLSDPSKEDASKEAAFQPPIKIEDINHIFKQYDIEAHCEDYRIGASVTTYEVDLGPGVRVRKVLSFKDDIARDLMVPSLRLVDIPGTNRVGFEIPNTSRIMVRFKTLIKAMPDSYTIPMICGEDTFGQHVFKDLADMPHLLIAGQTGSGKSVFLSSLIATIIAKKSPEEVKFLLVDPKQVEFADFQTLPHLAKDIACDTDSARGLLEYAVEEMEERFSLLAKKKVKKISEYNKGNNQPLPYIVFIIDEFSDLMMMGTQKERLEVEKKVVRIAQKARAVGIHMVLATQKPIVSVVTTLIKANMPARVAFNVASSMDSRVILDSKGAENLTGDGDMLFCDPNAINPYDKIIRVQSPWISSDDVGCIVHGKPGRAK